MVPVLLDDGQMTVLDTQVGLVSATAINNRGQVVWEVQYSSVVRYAFLWEDGESVALGDPWGNNYVNVADMNERGQMVGMSLTVSPR